MEIEILLSTMYQNDRALLTDMKIQSKCIIINQCNKEKINKSENYLWIDSKTRGLSKSRNLALEMSSKEICLLADDDMIYNDSYSDIIVEQFQKYTDYDIIVFQVEGIERPLKKYENTIKEINFFNVRKISSVEIAFKRDKIMKYKIKFDEHFGAGALFNHGEENIFLYKCLKCNLKILYVPIKIARIHIGKSSWFKGYNKKYFISNGAVFYVISPFLSFLFILRFAIVHYRNYSKSKSFCQAIKYMLIGRSIYKNKYKQT